MAIDDFLLKAGVPEVDFLEILLQVFDLPPQLFIDGLLLFELLVLLEGASRDVGVLILLFLLVGPGLHVRLLMVDLRKVVYLVVFR